MVRRSAAQSIGEMAAMAGSVSEQLLQQFRTLLNDSSDAVRIRSLGNCCRLAKLLVEQGQIDRVRENLLPALSEAAGA